MRMNLKVPFAEKDEAKKLGARWDAARKIWYVDGKSDMAPFARWAPTPADGVDASSSAQKSAAPARQESTGKFIVGSDYVERPRVCDCLPWNVCDRCSATALQH